MADIQIVTDSTAYLTRDYVADNNINVVPLSIDFDNEVFDEGWPGEFTEFFNKLKTSHDFPKTSQPPVGAFTGVFENAIKEGKEVIAIFLSSKLSGTYNSACLAAQLIGSDKISIIDSETTASNLKFLIEKMQKLITSQVQRDEIVRIIENEKKNTGICITVDTLDYLKKGGRLSGTQAFIGTILNIKPILNLIDGEVILTEKVRGQRRAYDTLLDLIPDNAKNVSICQIMNLEDAVILEVKVKQKIPDCNISIDELGPVIGAHLGPKAIGICFSW